MLHIICTNAWLILFYITGNSTDSVFAPKAIKNIAIAKEVGIDDNTKLDIPVKCVPIGSRKRKRTKTFRNDTITEPNQSRFHHSNLFTRRRHAADETAFILAKAITAGIRTIAFCKTRGLVEWVYERTLAILQSNSDTANLTSKVESYRGGYTASARRSIEERLFNRQLVAVVGTNALELGVDVGGVDLTLHTGMRGTSKFYVFC